MFRAAKGEEWPVVRQKRPDVASLGAGWPMHTRKRVHAPKTILIAKCSSASRPETPVLGAETALPAIFSPRWTYNTPETRYGAKNRQRRDLRNYCASGDEEEWRSPPGEKPATV